MTGGRLVIGVSVMEEGATSSSSSLSSELRSWSEDNRGRLRGMLCT